MSQVTIIETNIYTVDVPDDLSNTEKKAFAIEEWNSGALDDPTDGNLEFVVDELEYFKETSSHFIRLYIEKLDELTSELMKTYSEIKEITINPNIEQLFVKTDSKSKFIPAQSTKQITSDIEDLLNN